MHDALGGLSSTDTRITVPPGATALIQTTRSFTQPPWASETLNAYADDASSCGTKVGVAELR